MLTTRDRALINAKLTIPDVKQIRRLLRSNHFSNVEIAGWYKIHPSEIARIKHKDRWWWLK